MQQLVDNRYRLVKPLGSGGMADVYLAHDGILDRDVALKVMSTRYADDEEFVERFRREAQSAAALSHPNIVSIFDRGEAEDGTYYIAMEYLPGGTLKDRILKRGPLPPRTAAAVALQIAEALKVAHDRGVVHRDIKPHNILITGAGDVKVTDFGIARAASSTTMTRTGSILGTAHYISPEQAMGEPVGPASDLYSLGIVLYEMLTGELPYDADTPLGIAMKHVNGRLRTPKDVNPTVPDGINAITIRLLAKDPDDRYVDDEELIEDLERAAAGLEPLGATARMAHATHAMPAVGTTSPTRVSSPSAGRRERRRRTAPLLLVLLGLLLLAGLGYAAFDRLSAQEEEPAPPPMVQVPNLIGMTLDEAEAQVGDDFELVEGGERRSEDPVDTILNQNPQDGEARRGSEISVTVVGTQVAEVPGVDGLGREAAVSALEDAGFQVEVDEEDSDLANEGLVVGQEPSGGQQIEAGSEVRITVGTGPDTVQVPDLFGSSPDQAATLLDQAGLRLGGQSEDYSDEVTEGTIFSQDPAPDQDVEPGSSVDVAVSLGPQPVEVPEVYGLSVEEAQATLEGLGLTPTAVESTLANDEPAGTALATEPGVGATLEPGSPVTLYYSAGPPPVTNASPPASASAEPVDDSGNNNGNNAQPAAGPANGPRQDNSGPGGGGLLDNVRENVPGQGNRGRGNGGGNN